MGGICPKKKEEDPNIIDSAGNEEPLKDESTSEDPYYLNYEVKKAVVVIYIDPKYKECQRVQDLFASVSIKPVVTDISKDSNPKKLLHSLKKLTGDNVPPYTFIIGKYFGGVNEIEVGIKNYTIQRMINKWLDSRTKLGEY